MNLIICPGCERELPASPSDATHCYKCGASLSTQPAPDPDETSWRVYSLFNVRWTDAATGGRGITVQDLLDQLAQYGSPYRMDQPRHPELSPPVTLRLALVSDGGQEGSYGWVHVIHEWYELTWTDEDGGKWARGPEADDRPEGNRLLISSLENG